MPDLLVYMTYGRECYHQETMFSLLSARRHAGADQRWRPLVYTDRPADYAWLDVDVRELTPALMAEWVGSGYRFRRKMACVLDALGAVAGGRLAFLDGDTYFRRDPARLFDRIGPGRACLHLREIRLTRRPGTAGSVLGPLFDREEVRDAAGCLVRLRPGEAMWNSGVIGVDAADAGRARDALGLVDAVWTHDRTVPTLEQFAWGHVLADGQLSEAGDVVFHYWHRRQRDPFLMRLPAIIARARAMPLAEAAEWSWHQRPVEPVLRRAAGLLRDAVHRVGIDRRWTRASF